MTQVLENSPQSQAFARAWGAIAHSRAYPFLLLGLGTASNVIYAHLPLVAFAALGGATLPRRRAVAVALLLWLVNQSIGFGWRGYPLSATAFTWGALMGLGTLLVALFASWRPGWSQAGWRGHLGWMAIALLGGFVLYQGIIALAYPLLADGHRMGWDVISKLLLKQTVWGGAIALLHSLFLTQTLHSVRHPGSP